MTIPFAKYQGTGNDFVIIDQRSEQYIDPERNELIRGICDRRFGIGADGLILLQNKEGFDFEMIYFNADGRPSSMCGNGGRCIVAFSASLGIIKEKAHFLAVDGPHDARISTNGVALKMGDVRDIQIGDGFYTLDTGSPHYVTFVEDIDDIHVVENGQAIRYSEAYRKEGINVNFVEANQEELVVFTYERGVEDETLSCGTGVTAAALAFQQHSNTDKRTIDIRTKGGTLQVSFEVKDNGFGNIWLDGPATCVFIGELDLDKIPKNLEEPKYFS